MNWRLKSLIQHGVAMLPPRVSHALYYRLQRSFGGLRSVKPWNSLRAAAEIARAANEQGRPVAGARVFELGTGRRVNVPIAMWLLGADGVFTTDLHRYLRPELVEEDLRCYREHPEKVLEHLDGHGLDHNRFDRLCGLPPLDGDLSPLLRCCGIRYEAPADAASAPLPDDSIDLHVSTNVFEHVPRQSLVDILGEANRLVSDGGLVVHRVDHSDHFSHADQSLSPIHFLRFDEPQWDRACGNRYMYMNRLRSDDFVSVVEESGLALTEIAAEPDPELLREVASQRPPLDPDFDAKSDRVLATLNSILIARSSQPRQAHVA